MDNEATDRPSSRGRDLLPASGEKEGDAPFSVASKRCLLE